eukprot:1308948-Ditylum_brightwellii.AAC.1
MQVNIPTTIVAASPSGVSIVSNLTNHVNHYGSQEQGQGGATTSPGGNTIETEPSINQRVDTLQETIAALNLEDKNGGDGGDSDQE